MSKKLASVRSGETSKVESPSWLRSWLPSWLVELLAICSCGCGQRGPAAQLARDRGRGRESERFPKDLSSEERKYVHQLAQRFGDDLSRIEFRVRPDFDLTISFKSNSVDLEKCCKGGVPG